MDKTEKELYGWEIGPPREIASNPLYKGIEALVRCPRTGAEKIFSRFSFGPWVNILAMTPEKKIILVRQFRFGTESMEWELPGGMIERGEKPEAAGARELEEETGYRGKPGEIIGSIYPNPAIQDNTLYTVYIENAEPTGTIHPDPMEDIEVRLVTAGEIITMLKSGTIHHGFTFNALMHYALKKNLFTIGE